MLDGLIVPVKCAIELSILGKITTEHKNRSRTMKYLNTPENQLRGMAHRYGTEGAAVRRELIRRKAVGYWDGSSKTIVGFVPEFVEKPIMAKPVVMTTARKVEKTMTGRGR